MRTAWLMTFCCSLLLQIQVMAVETKVTKANAIKKVSSIDPRARALMNEMLATYRRLKSFSCDVELKMQIEGRADYTRQITLAYQKPRKVFMVSKDTGKIESFGVSDGTNYFIHRPSAPQNTYWKAPLAGPAYGEEAILQYGMMGPLSTMVFCGVDPFQTIWEKAPQFVTMGQPTTIAGAPVEVIIATINTGEDATKHTYYIGEEDFLLRRTTITEGKTATISDTYSNLKTNSDFPAATFVFTPPVGATEAGAENPNEAFWTHRLKQGDAPIPFKAKDVKGRPLSLEQYQGKVVLLNFWASWCGPCRRETPHIKAAYDKYKDRGFEFIGVSLDDDRKQMDAYLKQNKIAWRQIFSGKDSDNSVAKQYGIKGIPFATLIGRDGKIAALGQEATKLLLDENIQRAVAQPR